MNIIEITSLDLPELAVFSRLTEAQLRNRLEPEKGLFIAESPKVIATALDNGYEPTAFLTERRHIEGDAQAVLSRCPDVPVYTGDGALLASLTGYRLTRGVLCAMRRKPPVPAADVLRGARRVAVLEGIVDATNVGAIFRSAAALGVDAVLTTHTACDPLNRRAVRVSMGTVFQIPWAQIGGDDGAWTDEGIPLLREMGFQTVAMALDDRAMPPDEPTLVVAEKLAIVLGAEGDGLARETVARCDRTVCIPMYHGVDSLNVAAASAVAFWALCRRK